MVVITSLAFQKVLARSLPNGDDKYYHRRPQKFEAGRINRQAAQPRPGQVSHGEITHHRQERDVLKMSQKGHGQNEGGQEMEPAGGSTGLVKAIEAPDGGQDQHQVDTLVLGRAGIGDVHPFDDH